VVEVVGLSGAHWHRPPLGRTVLIQHPRVTKVGEYPKRTPAVVRGTGRGPPEGEKPTGLSRRPLARAGRTKGVLPNLENGQRRRTNRERVEHVIAETRYLINLMMLNIGR
jgi:hypothetical protein